jgi:hypothetical protein
MTVCVYWNVAMVSVTPTSLLTVSENQDYHWENCWLLNKMLNKMFYFYRMAETKQNLFLNNNDNFLHVDGNILETDTIHTMLNNEDMLYVIYNEDGTPMKHVQTYLQAHNVVSMFTKYCENRVLLMVLLSMSNALTVESIKQPTILNYCKQGSAQQLCTHSMSVTFFIHILYVFFLLHVHFNVPFIIC